MSWSRRLRRRSGCGHHPAFDRLETRVALVGDGPGATGLLAAPDGGLPTGPVETATTNFSVEMTSPAPGSVWSAPPGSIELSFSQPIYPDTVYQDVVIYRTDAAGTIGWWMTPDSLVVDDSATRLTATLAEPLAPGHYEVWVSGDTGIVDLYDELLSPDGNPRFLGSFDVRRAGATREDATDLGLLGPSVVIAAGSLDFSTDPFEVAVYKVDLGPGHFWRLGLEVTAEFDGSDLDSALALFDSEGHVLARDDVGRFGAPRDPYLFAGLEPGTYYVGVSGVGNLPGTPAGYDLTDGNPGTVLQSQEGGAFKLHLVADPVDTPPEVVDFRLDHADPSDPAPTGLTLRFSRVMTLPKALDAIDPGLPEAMLSRTIVLEDQAGTTWPVDCSSFDESQATISFVLEDYLPAGRYLVRQPMDWGLVDLAGLVPIAPGEPPGILAEFDVASGGPREDHRPVLLPGPASAGIAVVATLPPGQEISRPFVITLRGDYTFALEPLEAPVSIQLDGDNLSLELDPSGWNNLHLQPGQYSLRFDNEGESPAPLALIIRSQRLDTEIQLSNGVGQVPALSLRLYSFSASPIEPPSTGDDGVGAGPLPPETVTAPLPQPTDPIGQTVGPARSSSLLTGPTIRPQTTRELSWLGWSSDLVGRPLGPAILAESRRQSDAIVDRSSNLRVATPGQGMISASPTRTGPDGGTSTTTQAVLDEMPANRPLAAAMIELDVQQAVSAALRLQRWAVRQGTSATLRLETLLSWMTGWKLRRVSIGRPMNVDPLRSSPLPSAFEEDLDGQLPEGSAGSQQWLKPPVIAISVAAVAQLLWHARRKWRSRKPTRSAGKAAPRGGAIRRLTIGEIEPWSAITPMRLSTLHRSPGE